MSEEETGARLIPLLLVGIIVFSSAIYYFPFLSGGSISHEDEFLTLDRVSSVINNRNYIAIYTYQEPSFQKPPLQYYFSALLYTSGFNLEFSLRFPSYLFSLFLLSVTPILAWHMVPARIFAAPYAAALLAGSQRFWGSGMSALLDSGAALFCTLAILFSLLALQNRKYLITLAIVLGIGALQKTMVSSVFSASVLLFGSIVDSNSRQQLFHRQSLYALFLYLAIIVIWPLIQLVQFGAEYIKHAFLAEVVNRYRPVEARGDNRNVFRYVMAGEQFLRVPALISLSILPYATKRPVFYVFVVIISIVIFSIYIASGIVSSRHTLLVLPLLMASLAAGISLLIPKRRIVEYLAFAAIVIATGGPFKPAAELNLHDTGIDYKNFLNGVSNSLQPNEVLVFCGWQIKGRDAIFRGEVSYYAGNAKAFIILGNAADVDAARPSGRLSGAIRGVCRKNQMQELVSKGIEYTAIEVFGDYVHWTGVAR